MTQEPCDPHDRSGSARRADRGVAGGGGSLDGRYSEVTATARVLGTPAKGSCRSDLGPRLLQVLKHLLWNRF